MIRWYAGCCKTPIGNTLENHKISFVGLLHNCLETPERPIATPRVINSAERDAAMQSPAR